MGGCVIGVIKSSLHFVFPKVQAAFYFSGSKKEGFISTIDIHVDF